jgi:hypothetical protein
MLSACPATDINAASMSLGSSSGQRAPRRHDNLARALGAGNIEFDAEYNSMTLRGDDGRLKIPQFRPGLGDVLGRHAEMLLSAARPVRSWQAGFVPCCAEASTAARSQRRQLLRVGVVGGRVPQPVVDGVARLAAGSGSNAPERTHTASYQG